MSYRVLSKYRAELMGVAMLWVMCFHAWDLDLGLGWLNRFRAAGFGGVDMFVLLSSVGLVSSLSTRRTEYGAFLRRRASRILPAYFLVMVPYTIFLILHDGAPWSALVWNGTLLYYWVRSPGAFNWYVAGAMIFYALTPPLLARLRRAKRREAATAAGILLLLLLCQWLMQEGWWQYMDVFYRLPVLLLGLLIGLYVLDDRPVTARAAAFWGVCLALGLAYTRLLYPLNDRQPIFFPLAHAFLLTTVPALLALCLLFEKLPLLAAPRRVLRLIGGSSLEIYLLNVSVFSQTALLRRLVSFGPSNRFYYLVMFLVNIALGCLLHRAVEALRTKFIAFNKGENVP